MAQATVELRNLLKTDFELFDFDYPFDDKKFKAELEQAVIDYYYFYEIGQPTPDHFKHVFKSRWLRMIGGINELHNTTLLKYDILTNYSMTEALEQIKEIDVNQTTTTSVRDSNTRTDNLKTTTQTDTVTSDFPQQSIAGGDYLSGEQKTDSEMSNTGTVENKGTVNTDTQGATKNTDNTQYEKIIEGLTGTTYPELIKKHRDNIINIKQMVIEEMKPCFLLVH